VPEVNFQVLGGPPSFGPIINVNGTLNLLDLSHKNKVKKFVFSSSSSVYGNNDIPFVETMENLVPLSPYGLQKLIGEQYCRLYNEIYGLNTYCLRYFNVYGPNMPLKGQYRTALSIFKEKILKKSISYVSDDVHNVILFCIFNNYPDMINLQYLLYIKTVLYARIFLIPG
jgi:nucleoside-diphosphate-sugar epimerase